jgi:beta-N-acetylhexosaminidase
MMDEREIGKLFMIGFDGTDFSTSVKKLVNELNPCGVILFSRNVLDPLQLAALNSSLQRHFLEQKSEGIFIGVDQEGGRVQRLKEPFTIVPPAFTLASDEDPENAVRNYARIIAQEIGLVGFNLNFVPVLDVLARAIAPDNSVIGDRSYGHDPTKVARLGAVVMETMRSEGIITCCKHFPGHGGTAVDSHTALPQDDRPSVTITENDCLPFSSAVDMPADMIMTAHVLYGSLDAHNPATLSKAVIDGMLRTQLAYNGVVITDDLDMGAVSQLYPPYECALRALDAGADILLFCNHPERAFAARSNILRAIRKKEISETRIQESLERIGKLKSAYAKSLVPCEEMRVKEYFAI